MNKKLRTGMGLALLVCACVSTPKPNAALESARTVVRTAEADPNVTKYAALDLDAAKKDLEVAESAALHHDDAAVDHPAYLAAQTGRLAQFRASAKADDARVAAGQAERDQIRLAARAREVDKARAAADQAAAARDQAAEKAARLQAEVDALKAKPTDRGLVLTLGDVLFDTGKADLNPGATRKLDQLAQFLADHPDRRLQIDGFTDSVGTDSYNLDLSQRRANAVKSALQVRGIDATRITTQGYGKEFAVASNADSGGRQLNRRVEVVIGGENGAAVEARGRR
jgi:outer membrane protein OmpA-like peptidoglycan-associated protein